MERPRRPSLTLRFASMRRLLETLLAGGWPLAALLLAINAFALLQVAWDKRQARLGRRRVPEARLAAPVFFGGLPGLLLGMRLWRHKTRKRAFTRRLALFTLGFVAWLTLLMLALNDWQWRW
jgi:uncharacterized membrane protein YsdA (DUF1294 family)